MFQANSRRPRRLSLIMLGSTAYLLFAISILTLPSADADPLFFTGHSPRNYIKIFLSPAYHTATAGARQECKGKTERFMARENARIAGIGYQHGYVLVERGYDVAIGYSGPGTNRNESNAWGANYHLPIHSNASRGCSNPTPAQVAGTHVIYVSNAGSSLSSQIVSKVGPWSPGQNDKKGHVNTGITRFDCKPGGGPNLTEVCDTNAVAAYIEAEFHDWNAGVDWLVKKDWQWRIGYAVDAYLGYP